MQNSKQCNALVVLVALFIGLIQCPGLLAQDAKADEVLLSPQEKWEELTKKREKAWEKLRRLRGSVPTPSPFPGTPGTIARPWSLKVEQVRCRHQAIEDELAMLERKQSELSALIEKAPDNSTIKDWVLENHQLIDTDGKTAEQIVGFAELLVNKKIELADQQAKNVALELAFHRKKAGEIEDVDDEVDQQIDIIQRSSEAMAQFVFSNDLPDSDKIVGVFSSHYEKNLQDIKKQTQRYELYDFQEYDRLDRSISARSTQLTSVHQLLVLLGKLQEVDTPDVETQVWLLSQMATEILDENQITKLTTHKEVKSFLEGVRDTLTNENVREMEDFKFQFAKAKKHSQIASSIWFLQLDVGSMNGVLGEAKRTQLQKDAGVSVEDFLDFSKQTDEASTDSGQ